MMRRTVESKFDLVSAEYRLGRAARQAGAAQQSVTFRFQNFSVSKLIHFLDGIGIGFKNFWYRKKYRYRFRKFCQNFEGFSFNFGKFGLKKKFWFWFQKNLVSEKKSGFRINLVSGKSFGSVLENMVSEKKKSK